MDTGRNIFHVIVFLTCWLSFVLGFEPPYLANETGKYTYYIKNHDIYALCYYCPASAFRSDEDVEKQDVKCISKNIKGYRDPEEVKNNWYPYCNTGLAPSCREPPQIQNGNLTKIIGFPGYSVYSKWQVICHEGFRIKREIQAVYRCSEERQWYPNIDILSSAVCIPEVCLTLPEVQNGSWSCDHTSRPVPVGGTCHLHCDKGFQPNINTSIVCNNDLKWEGRNHSRNFSCVRLETHVVELLSDQPIGEIIAVLCILVGVFLVSILFRYRRKCFSSSNSSSSAESDSESIEMEDSSKLCSEASSKLDATKSCCLPQENEKQKKSVSDKKSKEEAKYQLLKDSRSQCQQCNVKNEDKIKKALSVSDAMTEKIKNSLKYNTGESEKAEEGVQSVLNKTQSSVKIKDEENETAENSVLNVTDTKTDKTEDNASDNEAENCVLSIPDALDDKTFNEFFNKICKIFDGLEEWPGLVKSVLGADEYTIKSVEKHRKGDPENGFTNYFIHGKLKSQNKKLGHILNYIDKNFKSSNKEDAMKLFKTYHKNCEFCSSIYS